jgi:hypothetical protein
MVLLKALIEWKVTNEGGSLNGSWRMGDRMGPGDANGRAPVIDFDRVDLRKANGGGIVSLVPYAACNFAS